MNFARLKWTGLLPLALASAAHADTVTRPDVLAFGATLESVSARLADRCTEANLRTIEDGPFLPDLQHSQQQIDCDGFAYMGEPRLAEFVFRDGILEMVWVMVDEDDAERVIAAMRSVYQGEGRVLPIGVAFTDHRTAWRNEPPEVLFYSEAIAPFMEAFFDQQSGE